MFLVFGKLINFFSSYVGRTFCPVLMRCTSVLSGKSPSLTVGKQTPCKLSFVNTSQVKLTVRTEPKFGNI